MGNGGNSSFKATLAALRKGTEGDFSGMELSADEVESVCAALHPRVVKLDMSGCGLGASGAASLAASLKGCTAVTVLALNNNQIGDSGAASLAASLKGCTALTHLDLDNNQFTDAGAHALAATIPFCQKLTLVNIDPNANVSAAGYTAV